MNYYLINISGKANKFFINDWFGETIIKENKDKIKPSANTSLDEFYKEIVMLNIILLAKTGEIIAKKSDATNYDNPHLAINNTVDVLELVLLLVKNGIFKEQLTKSMKQRYQTCLR